MCLAAEPSSRCSTMSKAGSLRQPPWCKASGTTAPSNGAMSPVRSQIVTSKSAWVQSSSMTKPMRRFFAGGSDFMSLTSRAMRSISSTSTSMTEAVRS